MSYIKLEDAILEIQRYGVGAQDFESYTPEQAERFVIGRLQSIPAADVRPVVRGRWKIFSPFTDTFACDQCGYQVIDESFRTNFCPDCGALMDKDGDRE